MPKKIKVILLEDITGLGRAGEIVSVSEGFARNSLFTKNQAALATPAAEHESQARESRKSAAAAQRLAEAEDLAAILENVEVALVANVKEGDDIYGKITAAAIAKELNANTKHTFKPKDIMLAKPITKLGEYEIPVNVGENVEANIHLAVKPD